MKKRMRQLLFAIAIIMALPASALGNAMETMTYADLQALLKASKGKVVMINFFASWCPPCREEIPGLMNIRKGYSADKLVLIGLSVDENAADLETYMNKTQFNYPVKKAGRDLVAAAGVKGIPHMLVFDPKGEVAGNEAGFIPEEALRVFLDKLLEK